MAVFQSLTPLIFLVKSIAMIIPTIHYYYALYYILSFEKSYVSPGNNFPITQSTDQTHCGKAAALSWTQIMYEGQNDRYVRGAERPTIVRLG